MKKIVIAGGCFWGVEAYYSRLKGVINTKVGYAMGINDNTTYDEVCSGSTNHAEVCEVVYDEELLSFNDILNHLFRFIDPTTINRQGGDIGSQYRTGIYYVNDKDKEEAIAFINDKQKDYNAPIATEVKPLINFCEAEVYHQKYLDKNPSGYCHVDLNLIKESENK